MRHGSDIDPPNRFEAVHQELDLEHLEWDTEYRRDLEQRTIEYIADASKSIVSENNSPDIPFRYSLNPYRGCIHACSYCYARPTHEYLGFNAGRDFETKIVVKHDAARLLREFLSRRNWQCEPITFSGVTDCYQPAEREFQLTRQCLEVALACHLPISIVTKNALVLRDLEILKRLAADRLVHVFLSITTLQPERAREMEPRTSIPATRLRAVETLTGAGIPTGVMVSPVIPGFNDEEIPAILKSSAAAGATVANYILLRLPLSVEPVFVDWLNSRYPALSERVMSRVRATRDGRHSNSEWGERMVGRGPIAEQIGSMFRLFRQKYGLAENLVPLECSLFEPPADDPRQRRLF